MTTYDVMRLRARPTTRTAIRTSSPRTAARICISHRALALKPTSSYATSRCRRWTCPFRRRSSTCSPTFRGNTALRTCLSPTTFRCGAHLGQRVCMMYLHDGGIRPKQRCSKIPCIPTPRAVFPPSRCPIPPSAMEQSPPAGSIPSPRPHPAAAQDSIPAARLHEVCTRWNPEPRDIGGHMVACHLYDHETP